MNKDVHTMPLVRIAGVKCFITIFSPNYGFCTVFIFQMKNQCIDKKEKKNSYTGIAGAVFIFKLAQCSIDKLSVF